MRRYHYCRNELSEDITTVGMNYLNLKNNVEMDDTSIL